MSLETEDWVLEQLPPSLRVMGPQHLSGQWLGLPPLAACAAVLAIPLGRITRALLARLLQRERRPELEQRRASSTRSLRPLGAKLGKVFIVVLAVMAFLSELGYAVTSLVAGLGIGGVAVALGAQKTLENLFGAFALRAAQPSFRFRGTR